MVLTTEPFLVAIQCLREAHLVARSAKLSFFMQGFEEGLLVEARFGFDELFVDPLQSGIFRAGKGIMDGLFECETAISKSAIEIDNGMTNCASDTSLCGRARFIEIGIVKFAGKHGHRTVATRTKPRGMHIPITLHQEFSRLSNREGVNGVVERTEMMHGFFVGFGGIGMAAFTVGIHHEHVGG